MNLPEHARLQWTLTARKTQFTFIRGDQDVLKGEWENGVLLLQAFYSYDPRPLQLQAPAIPGDDICLILHPCRIELYVNQILLDEEWPAGEALFTIPDRLVKNAELLIGDAPAAKEQPSVIGSFMNAEGWRPGNGVFVGDCMPYVFEDRYHVLYLKDRHHHESKWFKGAHQWAHISTSDFVHWDIHPMAVEIDEPWQGSICTGSHIFHKGKHYLYYSVRTMDQSPAPICRSVSDDGYHYVKDPDFRVYLSERYNGASVRDPKAVIDRDQIHLFVTTTDLVLGKGCLAHIVSDDGVHFREEENIYTAPDHGEPECSDYFAKDGKYYLIFSHSWHAQYRVSDHPFTEWKVPDDPYLPFAAVPKCGIFHDRIIMTGFSAIGNYAGTMTFGEAFINEQGELKIL